MSKIVCVNSTPLPERDARPGPKSGGKLTSTDLSEVTVSTLILRPPRADVRVPGVPRLVPSSRCDSSTRVDPDTRDAQTSVLTTNLLVPNQVRTTTFRASGFRLRLPRGERRVGVAPPPSNLRAYAIDDECGCSSSKRGPANDTVLLEASVAGVPGSAGSGSGATYLRGRAR